MVLTVSEATKAKLCADGAELIWYAELYLGPIAFLRVLDYTAGLGDTFTITITDTSSGTTSRTYTAAGVLLEGSTFIRGGSNAATCQSMRSCVNGDSNMYNLVNCFVHDDVLVVYGKAGRGIQASAPAASIAITSSDSAAWSPSVWAPINRVYKFISGQHSLMSGGEQGLIPEIASVSNVGATLDPYSRKFSIGNAEIVFDDPDENSVLREIAYRSFPRGKLVVLKYGTKDLAISDFVPAGTYVINEVLPSKGNVTVTCLDITTAFIGKTFHNVNPIPAIRFATPFVQPVGDSVTITIRTPSGGHSATFVEGGGGDTGWTGTASRTSSLLNLATTINSYIATNDLSCTAVVSADAVYVVPIVQAAESLPAETARPYKIEAVALTGATSLFVGFTGPGVVWPETQGWICMHPIDAVRDFLRKAGFDTTLLDASSFDSTTYTTISHFRTSAHDRHYFKGYFPDESDFAATNSPTGSDGVGEKSARVIDELLLMCQGGLVTDETGVVKFKRRDVSASVTRALSADDVADWEWTSNFDNMINRVNVIGEAFGGDNKRQVWMYSSQNDFSVQSQSVVGDTNPEELNIRSKYLGTFCEAFQAISGFYPYTRVDADDSAITILGAWRSGFSGSGQATGGDTSGAKAATSEPSSTRPVYIMLWHPQSGTREIVKSVSATGTANGMIGFDLTHNFPSSTAHRLTVSAANQVALTYYPIQVFDHWIYTITRGELGTTASSFDYSYGNTYACDITIAVAMAEHALSFAYGTPSANFRTTVNHCDLQIGDVITHQNSQYIGFLADGSTTNEKWEIVGKEIDWPWVRFSIALLSSPLAPTASVSNVTLPIVRPEPIPVLDVVTDNDDVPVTDNNGLVVTL